MLVLTDGLCVARGSPQPLVSLCAEHRRSPAMSLHLRQSDALYSVSTKTGLVRVLLSWPVGYWGLYRRCLATLYSTRAGWLGVPLRWQVVQSMTQFWRHCAKWSVFKSATGNRCTTSPQLVHQSSARICSCSWYCCQQLPV